MALAGFVIGIMATVSPCHAQSDDFDDNNDSGWTRFNPLGIASFTTTGGAYRITSPASPIPASYGAARAASHHQDRIYSDFCVVVDIVAYDEYLPQAIGIIARVEDDPGPGDTQGYTFTYQPTENDVQISRITGEQPTEVGSAVVLPFLPDPDTTLRLVLFGNGSYLEGRIYDASDLLQPLAVTSGDDSTYPTGTCGVVVSDFSTASDSPVDATFDNYVANDGAAPKLHIVNAPPNGVTLSWPDSALCWQLQTSTNLEDDSWSDVTTGITHQSEGATFSLAETFAHGGPRRFWKWRLPDGM